MRATLIAVLMMAATVQAQDVPRIEPDAEGGALLAADVPESDGPIVGMAESDGGETVAKIGYDLWAIDGHMTKTEWLTNVILPVLGVVAAVSDNNDWWAGKDSKPKEKRQEVRVNADGSIEILFNDEVDVETEKSASGGQFTRIRAK